MGRTALTLAALVAGMVALAIPSTAAACGKEADCDCDHGKAEVQDPAPKDAPAGTKQGAPEVKPDGKKAAPAPDAKKQGSVAPTSLDVLLAAKCNCAGPADCTCKKGECKCAKCAGHHRAQLVDTLSGRRDVLEIPQRARNDARSGTFI